MGENAPELTADFTSGAMFGNLPLHFEATSLAGIQRLDGGVGHAIDEGTVEVTWLCYTRHATAKQPAETVWFNRMTGGIVASPVCWDGLLLSMTHNGFMNCRDAETGRIHWTKRLGRCLASLVAGDGKVYALDQEGTLYVLAADAIGELLATHSFGENCSATPALAGGMLFARSSSHLHCIGSGE